ncbi:hypothetical protein JW899_02725 [Candidatus Uhrbacteria bacterium]|nr:hypothetical protein [Candidatus Uhrbacteria bacterium]
MRKKKHNADEIRFCQSRLHRCVHEFKGGETAYLISVQWENGAPLRLAVCHECFHRNIGTLIKEIKVETVKATAAA